MVGITTGPFYYHVRSGSIKPYRVYTDGESQFMTFARQDVEKLKEMIRPGNGKRARGRPRNSDKQREASNES